MINLDQFEGHTPGPWKRFEYKLGSSRIYVDEPRTLIADVHKNRGWIDSDGNERPDDEIATVYNRCDSDLLFHAPTLLAELRLMRELVEAHEALIDEIFGNFPSLESWDGANFAAITILKERLGYES